MNPALIKILRWIAFIPTALLVSLVAYYMSYVLMVGGAFISGADTDRVATFWMYTFPLIKGLALVLGGAYVAPSHEKKAACFLFVGHVLLFTSAAVMLAYVTDNVMLAYEAEQQPTFVFSVKAYMKVYFSAMGNSLRQDLTFLAGAAVATYSIYKEEAAIKWVFSATNTPSS